MRVDFIRPPEGVQPEPPGACANPTLRDEEDGQTYPRQLLAKITLSRIRNFAIGALRASRPAVAFFFGVSAPRGDRDAGSLEKSESYGGRRASDAGTD